MSHVEEDRINVNDNTAIIDSITMTQYTRISWNKMHLFPKLELEVISLIYKTLSVKQTDNTGEQ